MEQEIKDLVAELRDANLKGQNIRVLDVLVFGPLMVLGALGKSPPLLLRLALLGIGVGTIAYNARNFLRYREARDALVAVADDGRLVASHDGGVTWEDVEGVDVVENETVAESDPCGHYPCGRG